MIVSVISIRDSLLFLSHENNSTRFRDESGKIIFSHSGIFEVESYAEKRIILRNVNKRLVLRANKQLTLKIIKQYKTKKSEAVLESMSIQSKREGAYRVVLDVARQSFTIFKSNKPVQLVNVDSLGQKLMAWKFSKRVLWIFTEESIFGYTISKSRPFVISRNEIRDIEMIPFSDYALAISSDGFKDAVTLVDVNSGVRRVLESYYGQITAFSVTSKKAALYIEDISGRKVWLVNNLFPFSQVFTTPRDTQPIFNDIVVEIPKDVPNGVPVVIFHSSVQISKNLTVIWLHGGPHESTRLEKNRAIQSLVAAGVNVIAINYQGSTDFGNMVAVRDDDKAERDVASTMEWLEKIEKVSNHSVFLIGMSYGGVLSFKLGTRLPYVSGIISLSAPLNGEALKTNQHRSIFGNFVGEATNQLSRIQPPVLAITGKDDDVVDSDVNEKTAISQGISHHTALGVGHTSIWSSDTVQEIVTKFLDEYSQIKVEMNSEVHFFPFVTMSVVDADNIAIQNDELQKRTIYAKTKQIWDLFNLLRKPHTVSEIFEKITASYPEVELDQLIWVLKGLFEDGHLKIGHYAAGFEKMFNFRRMRVGLSNVSQIKAAWDSLGKSESWESFIDNLRFQEKKLPGYMDYKYRVINQITTGMVRARVVNSIAEGDLLSDKVFRSEESDFNRWLGANLADIEEYSEINIIGRQHLDNLFTSGGVILFNHYSNYYYAINYLKELNYHFDEIVSTNVAESINSISIIQNQSYGQAFPSSPAVVDRIMRDTQSGKVYTLAADLHQSGRSSRHEHVISFLDNKYAVTGLIPLIIKAEKPLISMQVTERLGVLQIEFRPIKTEQDYQESMVDLGEIIRHDPTKWYGAHAYELLVR